MTDEHSTRLNKFLALELGISRRAADELIEKKKVTINDQPIKLGARVGSDDTVKVNNTPVKKNATYTYIEFNKPVGYVCSRRTQGDNPTIYTLLPNSYHTLKPVGRLDKDSSGLILLTNDGDFAHRMTHPSFHKVKTYEVALDKPLEPLHQQMISDYGIMLEDGKSQFLITKLDSTQDGQNQLYQITMSEGRNRQIRRTFAALGYTVTHLYRTQFGNYTIDILKTGKYRTTTPR